MCLADRKASSHILIDVGMDSHCLMGYAGISGIPTPCTAVTRDYVDRQGWLRRGRRQELVGQRNRSKRRALLVKAND
jgi:hypothetical protein